LNIKDLKEKNGKEKKNERKYKIIAILTHEGIIMEKNRFLFSSILKY
jgi:hypothetical protein